MSFSWFYFTRTILNSIKKLFRTWVALVIVFALICGAIGGVAGYVIGSLLDETLPEEEEPLPDEEFGELTPEERENMLLFFEAVAGAIILIYLLFALWSGEKNGTAIFNMADVNFLFPAPVKPQTVLLFRLVMQMGAVLGITLYLGIELPIFLGELGLGWKELLATLGAWILTVFFAKVLAAGVYTLVATFPRLRRLVRPAVGVILAAYALVYVILLKGQSMNPADAALTLMSHPFGRAVPVFGWLRAIVGFVLSGQILYSVLTFLGCLGFAVLLLVLIRRLPADFYEDTLEGAMANYKLTEAQRSGKVEQTNVKRRHTERLMRKEIGYGRGGAMFFVRPFYHRLRTAYLRVFTKTSITYLIAGVGYALIARFAAHSSSITLLAIMLLFVVYFRNLGNPIASETESNFLYLVPDSPFRKLFYSLLSGTVDICLDLIPAFLITAAILGESLLTALLWLVLLLTLDFFAGATGLFTDLVLPSGVVPNIRAMLTMILRMLFLLPGILLLAILSLTLSVELGILVTVLYNLLIGTAFFLFSPLLLHGGKW